MSEEQTLLQIEMTLKSLMDDFHQRLTKIYDKYMDSSKQIPKLPPYEDLKDDRLRYKLSVILTNSIDELLEMKVRAGTLSREMSKYQEFQPTSKADYLIGQKFRATVEEYVKELDQITFELSDLVRNANNKIKILDSTQYYDV